MCSFKWEPTKNIRNRWGGVDSWAARFPVNSEAGRGKKTPTAPHLPGCGAHPWPLDTAVCLLTPQTFSPPSLSQKDTYQPVVWVWEGVPSPQVSQLFPAISYNQCDQSAHTTVIDSGQMWVWGAPVAIVPMQVVEKEQRRWHRVGNCGKHSLTCPHPGVPNDGRLPAYSPDCVIRFVDSVHTTKSSWWTQWLSPGILLYL